MLPRVYLGQEHLRLDLMLDVEDDLEQQVAKNSYGNVRSHAVSRVRLRSLVHNEASCQDVNHASSNEVEEEV